MTAVDEVWNLEPSDLCMELCGLQHVWAVEPEDAIMRWTATFSVWRPESEEGSVPLCLAEASLFSVTGREGVDLPEALDAISEEMSLFATLVGLHRLGGRSRPTSRW
jgi:hypothetical protein